MSEAPVKVGGAAPYARLDAPRQQIGLILSPEPMYVYKPRQDGGGAALKLDLRLKPILNEKGYVHAVEGGLYLELAAQTGKGEDGYARFGWQDAGRLTAKLGVPDISALLLGFRYVRHLEKKLPDAIRAKGDQEGTSLGLFHRFGEATTAIDIKFTGDGSFVRVSRSKTLYRSIKLSLTEELVLESYLRLALEGFLAVGAR